LMGINFSRCQFCQKRAKLGSRWATKAELSSAGCDRVVRRLRWRDQVRDRAITPSGLWDGRRHRRRT
jgi:hypothetical protein